MPERWLDGSRRAPDEEVEALGAVVARVAGTGFAIERARGGMSTPVYRLHRDGECQYLRLSEDPGGSMHAEAAVLERLRAAGVSVPEVIAVDEAPEIGRGVMLVREVPGEPLADAGGIDRAPTLRAAGRDLARINAVAVEGFGWIRRDEPVWPPRGEDPTYEALVEGATASIEVVAGRLATDKARRALAASFAQAQASDPPSRLAHGDFDATHIYQRDGRYTGVIDFGEMRGAESHYDLAFFLVQDPAEEMLPDLIEGYADVGTAPGDLRRSATVIVATQLCRWITRDGVESLDRPSGRWWLTRLGTLLADAT
ncbi:MAG: aminoglycoside phosphotransferase family protein [Actinomycetota bacterium]